MVLEQKSIYSDSCSAISPLDASSCTHLGASPLNPTQSPLIFPLQGIWIFIQGNALTCCDHSGTENTKRLLTFAHPSYQDLETGVKQAHGELPAPHKQSSAKGEAVMDCIWASKCQWTEAKPVERLESIGRWRCFHTLWTLTATSTSQTLLYSFFRNESYSHSRTTQGLSSAVLLKFKHAQDQDLLKCRFSISGGPGSLGPCISEKVIRWCQFCCSQDHT